MTDSAVKKKRGYQAVAQEEWIEMDDLRLTKNAILSEKFAKQGRPYKQPPKRNPVEPPKQNLPPSQDHYQKFTPPTFNIPNSNHNKKTPSIPMMEVACQYCTVVQNVPGNTQVYICGSCENMNECQPLYGICICGCCQAKMAWGFGTTQHLQCPKCGAINKVPLESSKSYQGSQISTQSRPKTGKMPSEPIYQKKFDQIDFFGFGNNHQVYEKQKFKQQKQRELQKYYEQKARRQMQQKYAQRQRQLQSQYRAKQQYLKNKAKQAQNYNERGFLQQRSVDFELNRQIFNDAADQYAPLKLKEQLQKDKNGEYPQI